MILIGDANGVDKAVQEYLDKKHYRQVRVFCMEGKPRNNVGQWETESVEANDKTRKDFAYFSAKDRAMAREANYGLMLWDGESRGTFENVVDLIRQEKPVVVYVSENNHFFTLRDSQTLREMLRRVAPSKLRNLENDFGVVVRGGSSEQLRDPNALL